MNKIRDLLKRWYPFLENVALGLLVGWLAYGKLGTSIALMTAILCTLLLRGLDYLRLQLYHSHMQVERLDRILAFYQFEDINDGDEPDPERPVGEPEKRN